MSRPTITAFYGPKQLVGAELDAIAAAIDAHKDLNLEVPDPAPWVTKYAMVYYSLNNNGHPFRMRIAQDYSPLVFSTDIISIVWGNYEIKSQEVYTKMYDAMIANKGYPVTLETMGGYDPEPNVFKTASVIFVKEGVKINSFAQDGETIQWK